MIRGATDDGSAPLTLLLTSAQEHLNYLKQRTVADQAGQISGTSWALMQATMEATEVIIEGGGEEIADVKRVKTSDESKLLKELTAIYGVGGIKARQLIDKY